MSKTWPDIRGMMTANKPEHGLPPSSGAASSDDVLLSVRDLTKHYPVRSTGPLRRHIGEIKAVNGVSFDLSNGETLGIVGESGCGKSTLARVLLRLEDPTSGSAYFQGEELFTMNRKRLRAIRREIQVVFQDPYSSLNPRMLVKDIVVEPWRIHPGVVTRRDQIRMAQGLLERVGLDPDHMNRYPHQFSGGQRQRIGIARALALNPKVIICDEAVSALDVSIQAQVVNLLRDIQDDVGISYVFIAHDLSVVRHIADRVAVMYLGEIVEYGSVLDIYESATHPYTQGLLAAAPTPNPFRVGLSERHLIEGELPDAAALPTGCFFRTRCHKAQARCAQDHPDLVDRFDHGHPSRCFYASLDAGFYTGEDL